MVISIVQWMMMAALSFFHPHHVSTTSIELNSADKLLEISVVLFADDLEKSLSKMHKAKVDVLNKAEYDKSAKLINRYITQQLQLEADGKKLVMNFIGFEEEKGNVLAYFEVKEIGGISTLKVENSLLRDTEKRQVNIIQVKAKGKTQTASLKHPETDHLFDLK